MVFTDLSGKILTSQVVAVRKMASGSLDGVVVTKIAWNAGAVDSIPTQVQYF